MIPDIAGDDYGISFLDAVKSYIDIFGDDPDSGRVDEDLVAFAVFDDFGVSGDDRDTGLPGRFSHGLYDLFQCLYG